MSKTPLTTKPSYSPYEDARDLRHNTAARLKQFRAQYGWSQSTAAKMMGISVRTLQAYECGARKPTYYKALRLIRDYDTLAQK